MKVVLSKKDITNAILLYIQGEGLVPKPNTPIDWRGSYPAAGCSIEVRTAEDEKLDLDN